MEFIAEIEAVAAVATVLGVRAAKEAIGVIGPGVETVAAVALEVITVVEAAIVEDPILLHGSTSTSSSDVSA
jgi:hypothetical protein